MTTPYWSELQEPKAVRDGRLSEDYAYDYQYSNADRGQSFDAQPPRKANRNSIQTTYTEALTETTFSPRSPTSPTIPPHGLAPRPSSNRKPELQNFSSGAYDNRRRSSRMPDDRGEPQLSRMPTAPDAPRGSGSYRSGNGAYPFTYPMTSPNMPSQQLGMLSQDGTQIRAGEYLPQQQPGPYGDQYQGAIISGVSERRKKFADDRSPLQRLELTLDSMTKEEKRARVEAAEQRAKARAVRKAAMLQNSGNQAIQKDSWPLAAQDKRRPTSLEQPAPKISDHSLPREAAAPREVSSPLIRQQEAFEETDRSYIKGLVQSPPMAAAAAAVDSRRTQVESDFGSTPSRSMSFRERAGRDDIKSGITSASIEPARASTGGSYLDHSGSNKLEKDPPADAWHRIRTDTEKRLSPQSQPQSPSQSQSQSKPVVYVDASLMSQVTSRQSTPSPLGFEDDEELSPLPLNVADQRAPSVEEESRLQDPSDALSSPGSKRRVSGSYQYVTGQSREENFVQTAARGGLLHIVVGSHLKSNLRSQQQQQQHSQLESQPQAQQQKQQPPLHQEEHHEEFLETAKEGSHESQVQLELEPRLRQVQQGRREQQVQQLELNQEQQQQQQLKEQQQRQQREQREQRQREKQRHREQQQRDQEQQLQQLHQQWQREEEYYRQYQQQKQQQHRQKQQQQQLKLEHQEQLQLQQEEPLEHYRHQQKQQRRYSQHQQYLQQQQQSPPLFQQPYPQSQRELQPQLQSQSTSQAQQYPQQQARRWSQTYSQAGAQMQSPPQSHPRPLPRPLPQPQVQPQPQLQVQSPPRSLPQPQHLQQAQLQSQVQLQPQPQPRQVTISLSPEAEAKWQALEAKDSLAASHAQRASAVVLKTREDLRPGEGLYLPPQWLDEWKTGTVGALSGTLLDLSSEYTGLSDKNLLRWEQSGHKRHSSVTSRPRKAEAFDGEYDNLAATRFKPPLFLKCGPLLRYCGIRQEKVPTRPGNNSAILDRDIWRGSIMIVTNDADSSYEIAPTLRLFVQDIELLPPPPQNVNGALSPEYVDPIAGHPKLGRRGETLYVRPVEHLEEAKDISRDETDEGLFEKDKSPPDEPLPEGFTDYPGSFANRRKRVDIDGEKMLKYKDVRGFRLHAEQGCTFWRFNIEIELCEKQQRIAYRINRGPAMGFWVPASGEAMNIMFHSCNGFSLKAKPNAFSGPDPLWRDVLNSHQTQPFHVMVGGGDQIYNDCIADQCELFDEWLDIEITSQKHNTPFTREMQNEMEKFYLERYCMWFSQGLFGLANSQIPMVNMYDDHDMFDGYGSYPHNDMNSPVFSGLGAVAFKYYMLFQHQSIVTETENAEPSWILGEKPGPYIKEHSRSLFMSMGGKIALLAVDGRTERTQQTVIDEKTWEKIMNRLYTEVRRGQVEHLLVLLGVPIAYPRLTWLENVLTSKPVRALGKVGLLGKHLNNIDGGIEVLDDLNDHWTAKNHKRERTIVIEDLQDLAIDKSLRVTILSGDVHLAAIGQFYSHPKLGLAKHKDPRYMPNIISSAIVNMPPPDLLCDILNTRNRVHHFDKQTDESMIPIFTHGVDGKSRKNENLLPHRNWCSIRLWQPGSTPIPSPPASEGESANPPASSGGGLLRRLSKGRSPSKNFDASRESVRGRRPPISSGIGGLIRSLSRSRSKKQQQQGPGSSFTRTMSLNRGEAQHKADMTRLGRPASQSEMDRNLIRGQWSAENFDYSHVDPQTLGKSVQSTPRGGAAAAARFSEFSEGDETVFSAQRTQRPRAVSNQFMTGGNGQDAPIRPFHRTPTSLSSKQLLQPEKHEVDLEGGLDISLNVEVNCRDPTGITVPYRILVPKLFYEYEEDDDDEDDNLPVEEPGGIQKPLSTKRTPRQPYEGQQMMSEDDGIYDVYDSEDDMEYGRRGF